MNAAKTLLTSLLKAVVDVCLSKPGTSGMLFVPALDPKGILNPGKVLRKG
jgi:hypothetical protein